MYSIAYIFLTIFLSVYIEVLAGSMGLILPFTALSVFYFSITFGWRTGLFIGIFAGTVLDMLYGRALIISPITMIAVAIFSVIWLHQGEPESVLLHFLPGTIVALISVLPLLLINTVFHGGLLNNFFILLLSTVAGAMLLPILIPVYDALAKKLDLLMYRGAKNRALERISNY